MRYVGTLTYFGARVLQSFFPIPSSRAPVAIPLLGAEWLGVLPLREAKPHVPADVLLHAGPPFDGEAAAPVLRAAAQALLFEGRFHDLQTAAKYLRANREMMRPAQEFGVVTPLAQVVSSSMPVAIVGDQSGTYCAPLSEGPAPALRFGSAEPACILRLRALNEEIVPLLQHHLNRGSIDIGNVVMTALGMGDECHARTERANSTLLQELKSSLPLSAVQAIAKNPGFVLPVVMAASAWWLARNAAASDCVTMVGGNGLQFGMKLHGEKRWRTAGAIPPVGPVFPDLQSRPRLGAIGDSAVIDFCGLGGQALAAAPSLVEEWKNYLPVDAAARREAICDVSTGIVKVGRVAGCGLPPIINLAILDSSEGGLIGRGFYAPPLSLFAQECWNEK